MIINCINETPKVIGMSNPKFTEYLHYQYLPIKLMDTTFSLGLKLEKRLNFLQAFIDTCILDFDENLDNPTDYYIYLTVKHLYQKPNCGFNRNGWHIDGFLSDDINYIWSNKQPTIFNNGLFNLTDDHNIALEEMNLQAISSNNITYPDRTILRLNNKVIHKVGPIEEGIRSFIKLTFSRDKFNLEGNSHNYELDYNWDMFPRKKERNHPSVC